MEEVRDSGQTSALHFINVVVAPSWTHLPVRNTKEDRSIRSHVMKNYIQQKTLPQKSHIPSSAMSSLSDHLTQFRLPAQRSRKRSQRSIKVSSASARNNVGVIMSRDLQNLHDVVLAKPSANDIFPNVHSPIDTSTPGTAILLEYYHTSFWDNSLAANPEGQWMSVAVSDPAILHATLCLVALHKIQTRREQETNFFLWQRGEAMRLISKNLADPEQAISDTTIAAVAVLCASDDSVSVHASICSSMLAYGFEALIKEGAPMCVIVM